MTHFNLTFNITDDYAYSSLISSQKFEELGINSVCEIYYNKPGSLIHINNVKKGLLKLHCIIDNNITTILSRDIICFE